MSLFPDLASDNLLFVRLFLHAAKGWDAVNSFWKKRGVASDDRYVAFTGYMRNRVQHTASVQWRRSHSTCCDVRIAFEARSPSDLYRRTPKKGHKLKLADFKAFIEFLQAQDLQGGVVPHFGVRWPADMSQILGSPRVKTTSLSFEVSGGEEATLHVDLYDERDGWVAVFEPLTVLEFSAKPVDSDYFAYPVELARTITRPLLNSEDNDG